MDLWFDRARFSLRVLIAGFATALTIAYAVYGIPVSVHPAVPCQQHINKAIVLVPARICV